MLELDIDVRAVVLEVYRSEIEDLTNEYDEYLYTGLAYANRGSVREAHIMLAKLASVERQLTYIKACLLSEYKQAATLH